MLRFDVVVRFCQGGFCNARFCYCAFLSVVLSCAVLLRRRISRILETWIVKNNTTSNIESRWSCICFFRAVDICQIFCHFSRKFTTAPPSTGRQSTPDFRGFTWKSFGLFTLSISLFLFNNSWWKSFKTETVNVGAERFELCKLFSLNKKMKFDAGTYPTEVDFKPPLILTWDFLYDIRFVVYDIRFVVYDIRFVAYDIRFVAYDIRFVVYDIRFVVYDIRFVAYDIRFVAYDIRFVVYDIRFVK